MKLEIELLSAQPRIPNMNQRTTLLLAALWLAPLVSFPATAPAERVDLVIAPPEDWINSAADYSKRSADRSC